MQDIIWQCGNCQYINEEKTRQGFVWCRHGKRWMPYHSTALRKNCHSHFVRQWLSKTYWGQQIKLEAERKQQQKQQQKIDKEMAQRNIDELF